MNSAQCLTGLLSIGYEQRSVDQLVEALKSHQVSVLVDVRLAPVSRKTGMSKRALAATLGDAGIEYVHEPGLGNPRDNRDGFRKGDPEALSTYADHLHEVGKPALQRVSDRAANTRVALLCFEREHKRCHRSIIIDAVRRLDPSITIAEA